MQLASFNLIVLFLKIEDTLEKSYVCILPYQICREIFGPNNPMSFQLVPFIPYFAMTSVWLRYTVKMASLTLLNIRFSETKGSGKAKSYRNILTIHFQRHQFKMFTIQHQWSMAACDPKKKLLHPVVLIKQLKDLFHTEDKFPCNIKLQNKLSPEVGTTRILDETSVFSSPSSKFRSTCTINGVVTLFFIHRINGSATTNLEYRGLP